VRAEWEKIGDKIDSLNSIHDQKYHYLKIIYFTFNNNDKNKNKQTNKQTNERTNKQASEAIKLFTNTNKT
jgi:hypothetical protein